jgi:hypothetical protein
MIVSHDGGVSVSVNRGKSWIQTQLPLAQMYHATVDNRIPYNVYGNRQDGPSAMVPSNTRTGDFGLDIPTIFRGHAETSAAARAGGRRQIPWTAISCGRADPARARWAGSSRDTIGERS